MADPRVKLALQGLAADSAVHLRSLVDGGQEIPYEVNESDGSRLPQYSPMTERFIREHSEGLRGLDAFSLARAAIGADLPGRYLEALGVVAPPEPERRAEIALIEFLAHVWSESSDFEPDPQRVSAAVGELEGATSPARGDAQLVTPLIGLQIPLERIDLGGATIMRADLAEVPAEARSVERTGSAPWEPVYLAVLNAPSEDDSTRPREPVGAMLRRLLTTLRLFKSGNVGTGAHAWVSAGSESWRRVSTGAPRPRPGGYRLAESELGPLVDLARALQEHPDRIDSQRRALARLQAGLERDAALDSLNDFLLALRYMLEGDGPARTGLAMRAAALSPVHERERVKSLVERAQVVERELWSGDPMRGEHHDETPAQLTSAVEQLVRGILTGVARGRIGADLRVAADEALLGDGLAVGAGADSDFGDSAEWGGAGQGWAPEPKPTPSSRQLERAAFGQPARQTGGVATLPVAARVAFEAPPREQPIEGSPSQPSLEPRYQQPSSTYAAPGQQPWLDEVDTGPETITWPERPAALQALDETRAKRTPPSERVTHLFPRTDTDWTVGELPLDRNRRKAAR